MFTEEEVKAVAEEIGFGKWELYSTAARERYIKLANALPAKREGEPISWEDVREGDEIEVTWNVNGVRKVYAGIVGHISSSGSFYTEQGGYIGYREEESTFRILHRPAPQLPTEAPAVILATEVRGVKGEWWLTLNDYEAWVGSMRINGWESHYAEHITAWKPADFVVRES
ncbi:hypothetical protein HD598_002139 [Neomicrococcus aestuarii]|uniref:Uncharacterized protein n=1 Tax=Neomicrococcus aestuarii TaxID=556325 RepID=A0A7W8TV28_9MICC|nr:hypothetical protein [Neomicrococcus aestuarii]MBB5513452.1 hypothetical protein [Neomicrococcus aestuarii]